METKRLFSIVAIFAFSLFGVASAHAADSCDTGWELMAQQSEGYQVEGCAEASPGKQVVELSPWGRIVYSRPDAGGQELVCDNNGEQPVRLTVAPEKADIGHAAADTTCAWDGNLYRCEGDGAPQMFCSTSVAVAMNDGATPTATTSVSTREASGMFPFNYKEDIAFGVKQMKPKVADCRSNLQESETAVELSWLISQSGEIEQLELRSEHDHPEALSQCLTENLKDFRFNEHRFAMQYWEQTFNL
ncbi:hypothetical protein [Marinobacter sp. CHS3-4]|uniref:hypothetical protein n=1 Tax=Marinobacter sp. CHS3-4 TaxID=3045174 RepID=UPI0024B59F97|nr:hypothetical protein [Marinobacter sp. CHS3-4]MDI9245951.1 hypothetical protein [Marinobacter sp. CHS3-4]